ncbi:MAG: MarR family winged helix-turn-helix transcriptional regulator [Pseudonocardiaceae bacterium]|jgi:DNA-binding MarR family transcriptional regulator
MADVTARATGHPLAGRASFLLSQLGAYSAHEFAKRLAPLGMRPGHFGLLMHLSRGEGQSQQRLADAMGIHRNVMVGLVDELEDRGLIERRRHPADRRAHAIHLTAAAHDLLDRAQRVADEHEAELLAGIGEDDRTYLIALLQHLAERTGLPSGVHPGLNDNQLSTTSRRC